MKNRTKEWALVACALALSALGFFWRGTAARAGSTISILISLVPEDKQRLACSSDELFGDASCAYTSAGVKRPQLARVVVPVVTQSRVVYLVADLFSEPAVIKHLAKARTAERFGASCRVKLLGEPGPVGIRFDPRAEFASTAVGWVAAVEHCTIGP